MDKANKNIKEKLGTIANGMGAWLIILILIVVMTLINDKFFTVSNFINVFRQVCVVGICALGVSFVVLGGEVCQLPDFRIAFYIWEEDILPM